MMESSEGNQNITRLVLKDLVLVENLFAFQGILQRLHTYISSSQEEDAFSDLYLLKAYRFFSHNFA